MKSWILALTLAALPAWAGQGALPPIALYTQFQQAPSAPILEAMQAEAQSIMAPAGFNFQWWDLATSDGRRVSVELAVITFRGRCDTTGMFPHDSVPGALGWTHISNGAILPFAEVDCDGIRGFIQRELLQVDAADRPQAFGRALGRVVAHELYHIFAKTTVHTDEGVGRSCYSAQNLLAPTFQFAERAWVALRNSSAHKAMENAATSDEPPPDNNHIP